MGQPQERREQQAEEQILARVKQLIEDEHMLRQQLSKGDLTTSEEHEALRALVRELDQCWDLLRQRRAKRDYRENAADPRLRPAAEVEGYLS